MSCNSCCSNYFTLTTTTTSINIGMPLWGGEDRKINKNIDVINFWTDELETIDKDKNSEPLRLTGIETGCISSGMCFPMCFPICFDNSLSNKFKNIWEIQNRHERVTITGLGSCMDGVYVIKNFHFETIKKNRQSFKWNMELEFVRGI